MKKTTLFAVGALALLLTALPAAAQHQTTLYVVHGIPGADLDLPNPLPVDISLNGACALTDFRFGEITDALQVPSGRYTVRVHLADAEDCGGAVAIEQPVRLRRDESVSIVAHLDTNNALVASLFTNDVDPLRPGFARLGVRHTANAPAVDVTWGRKGVSTALDNLANGEQEVVNLDAKRWLARIFPATSLAKLVGPLGVRLGEGTATYLYAVGGLESGSFTLLVQTIEGLAADQD